ncbi:MAG: tetratricopeptide repeat protein [Pseudomonadota bacterium]
MLVAACDTGQPEFEPLGAGEGLPGQPQIDPNLPPLQVGHAMLRAGEYDFAVRAFTLAIQEDGLTPEILIGLGTANERLGRLGLAQRSLEAAVELAPNSAAAWNNLGVVLDRKDDVRGAVAAFQTAFALDSGASDLILQNLLQAEFRLKDTQSDNPEDETEFRLVRRGLGHYLLIENNEQDRNAS